MRNTLMRIFFLCLNSVVKSFSKFMLEHNPGIEILDHHCGNLKQSQLNNLLSPLNFWFIILK